MTYRAITAIPNNEMKEIKKVKLCISLSNRIFLNNFCVMAVLFELAQIRRDVIFAELIIIIKTVNSNGNYNDDTIYM